MPVTDKRRDRERGGSGTQCIAHLLRTTAIVDVKMLPGSAQLGPHDINTRHVGRRIAALGRSGLVEHLVACWPVRRHFPSECAIDRWRRLKRPDAGHRGELPALECALAIRRDGNRIDRASAEAWSSLVADRLALERYRPAATRRIDRRAGRQSEACNHRHGQSRHRCPDHTVTPCIASRQTFMPPLRV